MAQPILYVVPIIDTEGPTSGREDMFSSWDELMEGMSALDGVVRDSLVDSFGRKLTINWFLLDWTGYSNDDANFAKRGHDLTEFSVWKHYKEYILSTKRIHQTNDGVYWHYHHPPKDGIWGWNTDWGDSDLYNVIVGKLIFEYGYFPSVYRAGKYVETNDNSHWLEENIPFDYSNISPVKRDFCDWSRSTTSWTPYHPAFSDYAVAGSMHRLIARSLPVAAKGGSGILSSLEIDNAFKEVESGQRAIFSFHSHDYYKSISEEFIKAHEMISIASKKIGIKWKYSNCLDALRWSQSIKDEASCLQISLVRENNFLNISINRNFFGRKPFVAIEKKNGDVNRVEVEKKGSIYALALSSEIKKVGIGISDAGGYTATAVFNNDTGGD